MKRPLDVEGHRALGAELRAIRDRLLTIGVDVANRYGTSSTVGKRAAGLSDAVDVVRSLLDGQAARDLGQSFDVRLYYQRDEAADAQKRF